ncbi:MAG: hypothetical protein EXR47_01230 [Dehalococcoidia bacterium]|nr:hypothetical protein [Dehalococcoidia bacterium]
MGLSPAPCYNLPMTLSERPITTPQSALAPGASSSVSQATSRALEQLEFTAVRQRLARYASCPLGAELAEALTPSSETAEVERFGLETAEARALLDEGVDLSFPAVTDVRDHVGRAAKAGTLHGPDLREVYSALQGAHHARQVLVDRRAAKPLLAGIAGRIPGLQDVAQAIAQAIGPQGDVLDSASPALRAVRSDARITYHRMEDMLQRIARSSLGRHVLQEPLVTERNGRPVLPVKASERGRLPGLVHDVSESGATIFVEPLPAIPIANHLQELRSAEAREVDRILRALSAQVGARADDALLALDLLAYLDLVMAKARYGASLNALRTPTPITDDMTMHLVEARHPLLGGKVVPLSLSIGPGAVLEPNKARGWTVLVITGPNAGGKTVALKTVGLIALMHQAGLQAPAQVGTALPVFDAVFADIGDHQSILQSLSSFTAHATAIQAVLAEATPRSLVLMDELGASTDPDEGAALGKAVLEALQARGVNTIATTHYRDVASFVEGRPGMLNASVELDPATLSPTYRLTMGLPGRSYALAIASRVGVEQDVLFRAMELLPQTSRQVDGLLSELHRERAVADQARREAEDALRRTEAIRAELDARLQAIEQEREALMAEARAEVQQRVAALMVELEQAEEAAKAAQGAGVQGGLSPELFQAREQVAKVRRAVRAPQWRPPRPTWEEWLKVLRPGDSVQVRGFHVEGRVLALPDAKGMAQVQVGALRLHVQSEQLSPPGPSPFPFRGGSQRERSAGRGAAGSPSTSKGEGWGRGETPRRRGEVSSPAPLSDLARLRQGPLERELDLRGMRADEALSRLDAFLDRALLHGLAEVQIVHGAATGALRNAVRERLSKYPVVKSWSTPAGPRGDGVTVVHLA